MMALSLMPRMRAAAAARRTARRGSPSARRGAREVLDHRVQTGHVVDLGEDRQRFAEMLLRQLALPSNLGSRAPW